MPNKKNIEDLKNSDKNNIEQRFVSKTEFRISDDGKKIVGYAAKFNDLSPEYYGFREFIAPGAFAKTIKEADIRALFNHNPDFVLGRKKNGTLELKEDKTGLWYEITPPDTQQGRDVFALIKRGDVNQSSFGFQVIKQSWEEKDDGVIRGLLEVKLFDISPVTFPWYPSTEAGIRSNLFYSKTEEKEVLPALIKLKNNIALKDKDLRNLKKYVTNIAEQIKAEPQTEHSEKPTEPQETHSDKLKEERAATWKYCICPECGYSESKDAGEACKLIKCPDCGAELTGSNDKPKDKSKSNPETGQQKSTEPQETHSDDLDVINCKMDELEIEFNFK